jgi:two-component system phosphate regulon sensor histidine kinase PhoR
MHIRQADIVFTGSILILLTFQVLWLYHTYQFEKSRIYTSANVFLENSAREEVAVRVIGLEKSDSVEYLTGTKEDTKKYKENLLKEDPNMRAVTLDVKEGLKDGLLQQILLIEKNYINLSVLDSLFKQKLGESDYKLDYLICYRDSAGRLLESIGIASLENKSNVFVSDSIPIVNDTYVHLISRISPPAVFKQMAGLTVASFCMFLILLSALIYQIRFIHNQYNLNKLKKDFSHALVHDLKTPLNTIQIVFSNYKNGLFEKDPEFGIKSTDIGLNQVLSIQTLIDRILTIAQSEENRLRLSREVIDLPAMIEKLASRYISTDKKKVIFKTGYALNDIPLFADKFLIENAIGNLIDNAVKYSRETVDIHISGEVKENKLHISVKDNGFGISPKDQTAIFNKFERGSAIYRKNGAKGFGLGLNYVKQVAVAHRGTMALYSKVGKGSEFVIIIPLLLTFYEGDNTEENVRE